MKRKKKVVIVTDFQGELSEIMHKNLISVFRETIIIEHCHLNELKKDEIIDGDILLFMLEDRIERARGNIKDQSKIIVISRTILEKKALDVMQIPLGSKVLVVNDYYETTLQFTSLLYKLKIKDLIFITYKDGEDYTGIQYAVTPGIPERVPKYIPKIVDVGVRVLDTATLVHILNKLEINDERVQFRLLKYINKVVTIDEGMKKQYREFHQKNEQLNSIMEKSSEGIILIGNDGKILLQNDKSIEMIGEVTTENLNLKNRIPDIETLMDRNSDFDDELIKHKDKIFMVSIKESSYCSEECAKIVILKDITYIKKLEQTISKKLKAAGLRAKYTFDTIIYESKVMKDCIERAKLFASTDKTVLIHGESGTGKELLAQSIHNESKRNKQAFVAINCAALPESLLESELFGYDKGAFTGARKEGKVGLFEQANNGTIFLDEIGDMPYTLQSRLLRVLQERQVMRIGSDKIIDIDVRIVAATNRKLMKEVDLGNFREDLYYRINVLPLKVPALRERKEDIIPLFKNYCSSESHVNKNIKHSLLKHNWRGNVREIKNVAEYYSLMKNTENPLPEDFGLKKTQKQEQDVQEKLLRLIQQGCMEKGGLGRQVLLDRYNNKHKDIMLSEYRLRAEIQELKDKGLIEKKMGRNGCVITNQGLEYIE